MNGFVFRDLIVIKYNVWQTLYGAVSGSDTVCTYGSVEIER